MPLTNTALRNAKPKEKIYRLKDGDGLFLQIEPKGGKYWRFRYFFAGKEKMLAFGTYPEISLDEAREKRRNARKLVANGIDPSAKKKEEKRLAAFNAENTFQSIAQEWHQANITKWIPSHGATILRRLELHIFPDIGHRPIKEIKPAELLDALRKVEKREATHLSHRLLQVCRAVFRYAVATGRAEYNPAGDLQGALAAHKEKHYPTLQAKELPQFFKKLEAVQTTEQNKLGIRLLLLTFLRQGEMRRAKWEDVDFDAKEWHIPAENTKMRDRHIVPLARQTIALLEDLQTITGESLYLFPSQHRQKNPIMSENTINNVLKKMGYKDKLVGHGFRALASTTLNEQGFRPDVIERQLGHAERNKVRAAYNRAEYLPERKKMMQHWANYLEGVVSGDNVLSFRQQSKA